MSANAEPLIIDTVMPAFDFGIAEHIIVRADPATTFSAARELDFLSVRTPLLDTAMWLRGLPARVTHQAVPAPPRLVLAEGDELPGWVVLGEQPDRELAFGAVGKFWQPNIEWRDVPVEEFARFAEPGWGKIAANFSVLSYGTGAALLSYECRTVTTDAEARRKFARYWWLMRPFIAHIFRCDRTHDSRQCRRSLTSPMANPLRNKSRTFIVLADCRPRGARVRPDPAGAVPRRQPAGEAGAGLGQPADRKLAVAACYDCHSNETATYWWEDVAPLSWWITNHVKDGRAALNFSECTKSGRSRGERRERDGSQRVHAAELLHVARAALQRQAHHGREGSARGRTQRDPERLELRTRRRLKLEHHALPDRERNVRGVEVRAFDAAHSVAVTDGVH